MKKLLIALLLLVLICPAAVAEEQPAWILCGKGSIVNIRLNPRKLSAEAGFLDACDKVVVDGLKKNGYTHIVEPLEGWVHSGYVVYSEPVKSGEKYVVVAKKRLAARRWIDGPRMEKKPWLKNGTTVTVYYWSETWCVTSMGYLQSQWLEVCP